MSIENQELLKRQLNEALGLMSKAVTNLNINDVEAVKRITHSLIEGASAVEDRDETKYLSVAGDAEGNVI